MFPFLLLISPLIPFLPFFVGLDSFKLFGGILNVLVWLFRWFEEANYEKMEKNLLPTVVI